MPCHPRSFETYRCRRSSPHWFAFEPGQRQNHEPFLVGGLLIRYLGQIGSPRVNKGSTSIPQEPLPQSHSSRLGLSHGLGLFAYRLWVNFPRLCRSSASRNSAQSRNQTQAQLAIRHS